MKVLLTAGGGVGGVGGERWGWACAGGAGAPPQRQQAGPAQSGPVRAQVQLTVGGEGLGQSLRRNGLANHVLQRERGARQLWEVRRALLAAAAAVTRRGLLGRPAAGAWSPGVRGTVCNMHARACAAGVKAAWWALAQGPPCRVPGPRRLLPRPAVQRADLHHRLVESHFGGLLAGALKLPAARGNPSGVCMRLNAARARAPAASLWITQYHCSAT